MPSGAPAGRVARAVALAWCAVAARPAGAITAPAIGLVGSPDALSTVAQRHVVRVEPPGRAAIHLMAAQNAFGGTADAPAGLGWWRSDDEGATWSFRRLILPGPLHLTADLLARGADVAAVYGYDTTETEFPPDAGDPGRTVTFQWWRWDGAGDFAPGPLVTVARPPPGQAYHRPELAFDGRGRIWLQAWLRDPCAFCGDTAVAWVSTDGGATFAAQGELATAPELGGGRLIATGSKLVFLWGDYSWDDPAQLRVRDDADPLDAWGPPRAAFPDGDPIYHGAAMNAVADGGGGLHVVYKDQFQQLWYRHWDGAAFGAKAMVDEGGDWAAQPAVTRAGGDLYVFVNHPLVLGAAHELRLHRLSQGFAGAEVLDDVPDFKGYPSAPEALPDGAPEVVCAFGRGFWDPVVRLAVARAPLGAGVTPPAPPPDPPPPPPPPPPAPDPSPPPAPVPDPSAGDPTATAALVDPFDTLDLGRWSVWTMTPGSTASASGGVLRLAPEPGVAPSGAFVAAASTRRFTGSSFSAKVGVVAPGDVNAQLRLLAAPPLDQTHDVGFVFERGVLYAFQTVGGEVRVVASAVYDPAAHAFWRLREAGGVVIWETSADGAAWVPLATLPTSALGFSTDVVTPMLDVVEYGPTGSPGAATFERLNR